MVNLDLDGSIAEKRVDGHCCNAGFAAYGDGDTGHSDHADEDWEYLQMSQLGWSIKRGRNMAFEPV